MKKTFCFIFVFTFTVLGQTFQNGFNFYLPPYDTTSQDFLPDFTIEPIGTNDFVRVNAEGNFEVNGKELRINGNNSWTHPGLTPDKDKAPLIAGRLRKFGFNLLRLGSLYTADGSGLGEVIGGTLTFNQEYLDKFFFYISELKKQGIRIALSGDNEVWHSPDENVTAGDSLVDHALCDFFDRQLIESKKKRVKNFLSMVNPYTGLALKDDPVLALMEVINENWMIQSFRGDLLKPLSEGGELPSYYSIQLDSLWNDYLVERYVTDETLIDAWHFGGGTSDNILQDPSFENSSPNDFWKHFELDGATANLEFISGDGVEGSKCAQFIINNTPGGDWQVQFYQDGITVKKDTTYQIEFWAKAENNISIKSTFSMFSAPYTEFGSKVANLSTTWQKYTYSITTTGPTNEINARLSFQLGENAGAVFFDNVTLRKYAGTDLMEGESLALRNIKRFQCSELTQFASKRKNDEVAFYIDIEEKYFDEFYDFYRNDVGLRVPISGTNFLIGAPDNKIQSRMDYVDNHNYYAGYSLPMVQNPHQSTIKSLYRGMGYKNKPFVIGEYDHPYFDKYFVETPFFITAYSSLHDADAILFFCYAAAQPIEEDIVLNDADYGRNNLKMAFAPSFAKAFRDRFISVADETVEIKMSNEDVLFSPFATTEWNIYPDGFPELLGLTHKVVVSDYNSPTPFSEQIIPTEPTNPYVSDTQELVWDENGIFTINTPKFIAAVGFLQNYANKEIGDIKIISADKFAGFSWISLTDDNLDESAKSLLTVGSRQENTNTVWNPDNGWVIDHGTAPTWIEPINVSFELNIKADSIRVHQLGKLGETTGTSTIYYPIAGNKFRVDIDQSVTKTLWYGIQTSWGSSTQNTTNILNNGDFSSGFESWSTYIHTNSNAEASIEDGAMYMNIVNGGDQSWNVQLLQHGLTLEHGKSYKIQFEASVNSERTIVVGISEDGGNYTPYCQNNFSIEGEMKTYSFTYIMNSTTDNNARFYFDLGGSNESVRIDNVFLIDLTPTGIEENKDSIPIEYSISQNYPNPFNPSTRIRYSIAEQGHVSLSVFDILGREIVKLVDEEMSVGKYEVFFNASHLSSGIYFYKITSGDYTKASKMILLK